MHLASPSPEATRAAARALGRANGAEGLVLALEGPLGAGKTLFVQGLAEGLGLAGEAVASPTFVIVHQYGSSGGRALAHVDLYRVSDREELEATGFADLFAAGAVVAVEWADRLPEALPADRLQLRLARPTAEAPERRELDAVASGPVARAALSRWREALGATAPAAP